jgi:hypothetical protein
MKEEKQEKVSVKQEDPTEPMKPTPPPQDVPPEPEMDPRLGDKTPAYMEWLAKFYPEDFKKRYAGRKVFGERMPPVITEAKVRESNPLPPVGSDVPASSMAKEAKEQWL